MKKKLLSFIPIFGLILIFRMDECSDSDDNFNPLSPFYFISAWYHGIVTALILIERLW